MTDNTADVWSSAEMFVSLSSVASCQTEHNTLNDNLEVFVFPDLLWALELYKCISNVNIGNFTMHHGTWSLTVYCWILFLAVIWTEWMIKISHKCVCFAAGGGTSVLTTFMLFGDAPWFVNWVTMFSWPIKAATWMGVSPDCRRNNKLWPYSKITHQHVIKTTETPSPCLKTQSLYQRWRNHVNAVL